MMIQVFEVEVDTGTNDDEGVTAEQVERCLTLASGNVGLGGNATVLVEEIG